VGLLAACNRSEAPKSAPPPPPPVEQAAFRVTRVDLGNAIGADKKVAAPSDSFKPNDTIYASILTEGATSNVALGVRWTFEDGQVVNESKQTIAPTGPAITEFHIAKPDGFPAGKYKIEVSTNDQLATTKQFTVVD
jgi:hypothetical protein